MKKYLLCTIAATGLVYSGAAFAQAGNPGTVPPLVGEDQCERLGSYLDENIGRDLGENFAEMRELQAGGDNDACRDQLAEFEERFGRRDTAQDQQPAGGVDQAATATATQADQQPADQQPLDQQQTAEQPADQQPLDQQQTAQQPADQQPLDQQQTAEQPADQQPLDQQQTAQQPADQQQQLDQTAETEGTIVIQQPAPQVQIDQPEPQITVRQASPDVTIMQAQPEIIVNQPAPQVTVHIPQPEIIVRMPQPEVNVSQAPPEVSVQQAQPSVEVIQPEQQAEVVTQPSQPTEVQVEQQQANIQFQQTGQPNVQYQAEDPQVSIQQDEGGPTVRFEQMDAAAQQQPQAGQQPDQQQAAQQPQAGQQPDQQQAAQQPAAGQQQAQQDVAETGATQQGEMQQIAVSELVGLRVVNANGEELGEVDSIVVDGNNQQLAVISHGGLMGVGEDRVAMPLENVRFTQDALVIHGLSEEQLDAMPEFDDSAGYRELEDNQPAQIQIGG